MNAKVYNAGNFYVPSFLVILMFEEVILVFPLYELTMMDLM